MTANATTSAWTSSATLDEIAETLRGADNVLILTHAKPDGDAVGSTLAIARTLARLGKTATPLYLAPWPTRFDAIVGDTPVVLEHRHCLSEPPVSEAESIVIADTGSWNQVADARAAIERLAGRVTVIDHHAHGDADIAPQRYIDPGAAAACEIIAGLCCTLLGAAGPSELPIEVATPLYLGIATDTGWFRFPNCTSRTLRLAADLIDAGVDADELYRISDQSDSPARILIMRRALASLQFVSGHAGAVMRLLRKDFEETGATDDEAGGIIDLPKSIGETQVVALLTELENGNSKVSLRSKAGENEIDVNLIAQQFGGGGHKHAAGAKIAEPIDEATRRITEAVAEATSDLSRPPT